MVHALLSLLVLAGPPPAPDAGPSHVVVLGALETGLLQCARLTFASSETAFELAAYVDEKARLVAVVTSAPDGAPPELLCPHDSDAVKPLFPKGPVGKPWGKAPQHGFKRAAWCAPGFMDGPAACSVIGGPVAPPPPPPPKPVHTFVTGKGYRMEAQTRGDDLQPSAIRMSVASRVHYCAHLTQPAGGTYTVTIGLHEDRGIYTIVSTSIAPARPALERCVSGFNANGTVEYRQAMKLSLTPDASVPVGLFQRWSFQTREVRLGTATAETVKPYLVDIAQAVSRCAEHRAFESSAFPVKLRITMDRRGGAGATLKGMEAEEVDQELRGIMDCAQKTVRVEPPGADTMGYLWGVLLVSPVVEELPTD